MYQNKKISVVIPCYNEEEGIASVLKSVPSWVDEVLVVDNNSFDQTAPIARKLGATVVHEAQQGYGAACRKGLKLAKGEIIAAADADGTYPLNHLGRAIDYLLDKKLDFVAGNRFPLKNKAVMPWPNRLGNRILTFAMNLLVGQKIRDSQTGLWVFRRRVLDKMDLRSSKMSFSEEIKMEALCNPNIKYGECHIDYRNRIGLSKLRRFRDGLPNLLFLFKKRWQIYRRKH